MILTCRSCELGGSRWEGRSVQRGSAHEGLEVGRHRALGQSGAVTSGTERARPGGGGAGTQPLPASPGRGLGGAWIGLGGGALTVLAGKVPLGQLPRAAMENGVRIVGQVVAGVDDDAQVHSLRPRPSLSPPRLQALGTTWRDWALSMSPPPGRQPTLQPRGGVL